MCKVPGLHDRNRNGPAHQTASLLGYQVQRVEGLGHWGAWVGELDTESRVQTSMFVHTHTRNHSITPHDKTVPSWTKVLPASLSPLWQWVRPSQLLTHRLLHQEEGCPVWWGQAFRWEQSYWSRSINWTSRWGCCRWAPGSPCWLQAWWHGAFFPPNRWKWWLACRQKVEVETQGSGRLSRIPLDES